MVYTGGTSREDLLSAMRQRHTYAATANIVADFRCLSGGHDYMLGDSLSASVPPTFRLRLIGTAPFSKVTWIQDDQEVKVVEPHKADVEMTWTGPQPATRRTSYTYVRGEQDDGELVWVSPIWVTYAPHG